MESFSHIDLYYLTKEFQNLVEQRVDDFFLTENFFTIHIYSKKEKNVFLKINLGNFYFMILKNQGKKK